MAHMFTRVSGWWRLRFGFCPLCNSSPPNPRCSVCLGHRPYGRELDPAKKEVWKARWKVVTHG